MVRRCRGRLTLNAPTEQPEFSRARSDLHTVPNVQSSIRGNLPALLRRARWTSCLRPDRRSASAAAMKQSTHVADLQLFMSHICMMPRGQKAATFGVAALAPAAAHV